MLKYVFFYFTQENGTELTELMAELDLYQVEAKQIKVTDSTEIETAHCPEETLCVTDSGKACRFLLKKQIPVIAFFRKGVEKKEFGTVKYAVEAIEAMDYLYLRGVYQRYNGIPWEILETNRCLVREITVADVETLYELYKEPSITFYMEGLYPSMEAEREYTEKYIENVYGFYEYGMWIVIEKATGKIIGRAGLEYWEGEEKSLELGYMIASPYQRRGFAYEVCSAITEYAVTQLEMEAVHSLIEKENIPSVCLSRKLGFSYIEEREKDGKCYQHYSYMPNTKCTSGTCVFDKKDS